MLAAGVEIGRSIWMCGDTEAECRKRLAGRGQPWHGLQAQADCTPILSSLSRNRRYPSLVTTLPGPVAWTAGTTRSLPLSEAAPTDDVGSRSLRIGSSGISQSRSGQRTGTASPPPVAVRFRAGLCGGGWRRRSPRRARCQHQQGRRGQQTSQTRRTPRTTVGGVIGGYTPVAPVTAFETVGTMQPWLALARASGAQGNVHRAAGRRLARGHGRGARRTSSMASPA